MKKIIAILFLFVCLASCSKSEYKTEYHMMSDVCGHSELEHHAAVSPSLETFGNIEFWQCCECGLCFTDAKATSPLEGCKYLLPTKFVNPVDYIHFKTKGQGDDIVSATLAIISMISILVSVSSMVTSLLALEDKTEDIADKIKELTEQEIQNQETLDDLQHLTDELVVKLADLTISLHQTSAKLRELIQSMETTQTLMNSTESLEDAILVAIMDAQSDIETSKLLDARYRSLQDLKFADVCAFNAVHHYMDGTNNALDSALNQQDSLTVFSDLRKNILHVISDWGSERACHPSTTATLLEEFINMTYDDNTSFLSFLTLEASEILPWRHQIIIVKKLFALRELCIISLSAALAQTYYRFCCGTDNLFAQHTAESIGTKLGIARDLYDQYYAKWSAESNVGPWHCNVTGRDISQDAVYMYVVQFISKNEITMKDGKMVSCTKPIQLLYGIPEGQALLDIEWELLNSDFLVENGREAESVDDLLFSTGRPGMIFNDTAPGYTAGTDKALSYAYSPLEYFCAEGYMLRYYCRGQNLKYQRNDVLFDSQVKTNGTFYEWYDGAGYTSFYTLKALQDYVEN